MSVAAQLGEREADIGQRPHLIGGLGRRWIRDSNGHRPNGYRAGARRAGDKGIPGIGTGGRGNDEIGLARYRNAQLRSRFEATHREPHLIAGHHRSRCRKHRRTPRLLGHLNQILARRVLKRSAFKLLAPSSTHLKLVADGKSGRARGAPDLGVFRRHDTHEIEGPIGQRAGFGHQNRAIAEGLGSSSRGAKGEKSRQRRTGVAQRAGFVAKLGPTDQDGAFYHAHRIAGQRGGILKQLAARRAGVARRIAQ